MLGIKFKIVLNFQILYGFFCLQVSAYTMLRWQLSHEAVLEGTGELFIELIWFLLYWADSLSAA